MVFNVEKLWYGSKKKPVDLWGKTSTPKKRSSCPKAVKETVWRKYFGNKMSGKCYVCDKAINFTDFEVGHNKPFTKGGKWNVNNLRPICRTCNRSMRTMSIETFKKRYFSKTPIKKRQTTKKGKKKATQPKGIYWKSPFTGKEEPLLKY